MAGPVALSFWYCLAGPVVAAAAILPRDLRPRGLDDSKKLDEKDKQGDPKWEDVPAGTAKPRTTPPARSSGAIGVAARSG